MDCVSLKFVCWNPNLQYDGNKRWDLWEVFMGVEYSMSGISALIKMTSGSALARCLPWKDTMRNQHLHHEEVPSLELTVLAPDHRLPASITMWKKFLLFISLPLYGIASLFISGLLSVISVTCRQLQSENNTVVQWGIKIFWKVTFT
jgi:hypothetical protein